MDGNQSRLCRIVILFLSSSLLVTSLSSPCTAEVKIGVMAPLTGNYASAGENIRKGLTIAESDLKVNGIEVKVSFEDACLPAEGVGALQKLMSFSKVDAIVSNYCVITLAAIKKTVAQQRIPTFQNSVYPEEMVEKDGFIFSTWPTIDDEVDQIIKHSREKLGLKKAAVVFLATPWGEGYANSFKKLFTGSESEVVDSIEIPIGMNDFRPELVRALSKKPDILMFAHTGSALSAILQQARTLGFRGTIFVPSDADDESIVRAAGAAAEGMLLYSTERAEQTSEMKQFAEKFNAKFHETPNVQARHAYDQLTIMVKALNRCKSDRTCTAHQIRELGPYEGVSGPMTFHKDGHVERAFSLRSVRNGKFELVPEK